MANLNEQLLKIVDDYRAAGEPWPDALERDHFKLRRSQHL